MRELDALAHERFGRTVLQLAVRRVLDQGPTIALWGARRPGQLDPVAQIDGWHIDESSRADIDAILRRHVPDAVAPDFMAPPAKRPLGTCVPPARPGGQARWQAQQFPR